MSAVTAITKTSKFIALQFLLLRSLRSSSFPSLKRYWDVDEAPSWFYQGSEGTAEFDRRKAVRIAL
jgi:hypothetical protein